METYNTEAIIASSLDNVTKLKEQLSKMEQLRDDVNNTISLAREIPEHFNRLGGNLAASTTDYIVKNEEILKEQIQNFDYKISDLQQRIQRIDEIDFTEKFQNSKNVYFEELSRITDDKIKQFDNSADTLRIVKTDFENEVSRLVGIDLEQHFDKHDKRLSDIFGATNNVNSTLLAISNQTIVFQDKLASVDQKTSDIAKGISELQLALTNELNSIKTAQSTIIKKQNSNFTVLMIIGIINIIAIIALYFLK